VSTSALVLVLASAFFHAVWNALLKRETDSEASSVAVLAVAGVVGWLWALFQPGTPFSTPLGLLLSGCAGLFEALYFLSLGKALQRAPLGSVYTTARGGAMAIVWPFSLWILNEPLRWLAAVGTLVLALGLWRTHQSSRQGTEKSGMAWAWVCALSIGGYHLCQKLALTHGAAPSALFAMSLVCALPLNLWRGGRPGLEALSRAWKRSWPSLLGAGVLCAVSFLLLLFALRTEGAGVVLTLRNTSIAWAVALGMMQGEPLVPARLQGAALVLIGAVLIGWPS
jgi:drug/metabolite transporter (DMT)-like permease